MFMAAGTTSRKEEGLKVEGKVERSEWGAVKGR